MSRVAATNKAFDEARTVFKPLAIGPCPTDLYERIRWDMAGAWVPFSAHIRLIVTIPAPPFGPNSHKTQSCCHHRDVVEHLLEG
jgi:hypothetical protein